jgi:hypothetical protein
MRHVRLTLIATAAVGLTAIAAPAFAAEIVATPDGHYYRLVPVRGPAPGTAPEVATIIPGQATASVPPASSCRLVNFLNNEYQPEYTTVCGPP